MLALSISRPLIRLHWTRRRMAGGARRDARGPGQCGSPKVRSFKTIAAVSQRLGAGPRGAKSLDSNAAIPGSSAYLMTASAMASRLAAPRRDPQNQSFVAQQQTFEHSFYVSVA
jgi:hypothetical protein